MKTVVLLITGIVVLLYAINAYKNHGTQLGGISSLFSILSMVAVGGFIWLFINRVISNLSGKNIAERRNEEVSISESGIRYAFGLRNQLKSSSRYIITWEKSRNNYVQIDDEKDEVTFWGKCICQNVKKYGTKYEAVIDEKILPEFKLYDYFEPSLISELQKIRRN